MYDWVCMMGGTRWDKDPELVLTKKIFFLKILDALLFWLIRIILKIVYVRSYALIRRG